MIINRRADADQINAHEIPAALKIAIIGGGPGGLMTAYLLQKKCNRPVNMTLFEASDRLGGKVLTPHFDHGRVNYEAGAAEFYDYSVIDEDPLKELIVELGLSTVKMEGQSVVLDRQFIGNLDDLQAQLGTVAGREWQRFHNWARDAMSPTEFFANGGPESCQGAPLGRNFGELLQNITSQPLRRYIERMIHSDLATEPENTNANYGLQNYLMNDPAFMGLYGIEGGNELLTRGLAARIDAHILLRRRVDSIATALEHPILIHSSSDGVAFHDAFDFVVVALPLDSVSELNFEDDRLAAAIGQHIGHHDHPAHYLRITLLFERPFWSGLLVDSYCMLDGWEGCCLYDESSRLIDPRYGVLGWLLGGQAAVELADSTDEKLIELALQSLPDQLRNTGAELYREGRVHRWIGAVNAMPGGQTFLSLQQRHQPARATVPQLFLVGDYLFDSTINGVLDSADFVTDGLAMELNETSVHHLISLND